MLKLRYVASLGRLTAEEFLQDDDSVITMYDFHSMGAQTPEGWMFEKDLPAEVYDAMEVVADWCLRDFLAKKGFEEATEQ